MLNAAVVYFEVHCKYSIHLEELKKTKSIYETSIEPSPQRPRLQLQGYSLQSVRNNNSCIIFHEIFVTRQFFLLQ
jgi:hypothetical protein